jgi:medium-chain acyl-[acyl-carrier-protein] hydrolase
VTSYTCTEWTERFRIRGYECDPSRCVTPQALCDLLQETAGRHTFSLGIALEQTIVAHRETWMLHRLALRIHEAPEIREEIVIETWPCGVERIDAIREFCVRNTRGNILAEAATSWLMVSCDDRRILREPVTPYDWSTGRARALPDVFRKRVVAPVEATHVKEFDVRRHDIDLNRHVNHVHFLTWALEALPDAQHQQFQLVALDAEYLAEALPGERVRSECCRSEGPAQWHHQVVRASDGRVLLKMRSEWKSL